LSGDFLKAIDLSKPRLEFVPTFLVFLNVIVKNIYTLLFIISLLTFVSCKENQMPQTNSYALRLKPGQDLKKSIQQFVNDKDIKAGWMATCVGSLTQYQIRFANQPSGNMDRGYFEIVSLTGTVSTNGSHIHISLSDSSGATLGGHLMDGCIVYTTAEIIIQEATNLVFTREEDGTTEWEELQVKER
jgi:hypothetical protein